jgi:hypothetical protein
MTQRIRGQEATIRVAVDGVIQRGSMFKVKDFTVTPRQDLTETPYLGEDEDDLDFQHHGYDMSWTVDMLDATTIALLSNIVARETAHLQHPIITITVMYTFREGAAVGGGRTVVYHDNLVLKQGDEGFGGRKEFVSVKYEAKCKKRDVLVAA